MDKLKKKLKYTLNRMGYYTEPDFIIIGAEKAGSTGLFDILKQHPSLIGSFKKEVHYFDNEKKYQRGKLSDYHHYFPLPHAKGGRQTFEATPSYFFHPLAPERIARFNPQIKLIVILRNPVIRALSAWTMFHYKMSLTNHPAFYDPRDFEQVIREELYTLRAKSTTNDIFQNVRRGIYHEQLVQWWKHFKKEQMLILESDRLLNNHHEEIAKVCSFLNIPFETLGQKITNKSLVANKDQYESTLAELYDFYQPHNEQLFKMIGERFDWN